MMIDLSQFIGCPFRNRGRGEIDSITRMPAYDCYGLFRAIYRAYGIDLPDFTISCFATDEIRERYEQEVGGWEETNSPDVPCAVALATDPNRPGMVCHFGVYIGHGRFIHTLQKTGSIVSTVYDTLWERKIKGYYRWKKRSS